MRKMRQNTHNPTLEKPRSVQCGSPPGISCVPAKPGPAEHSPALLGGGEALLTVAAVLLLSWRCAAAAALL